MHVRFGPGAGPAIAGVEFAEGMPVGQRQFRRVANSGKALLGGSDQENAAKALLRQAAEIVGRIAFQQQYLTPGVEQFERGADSGDPAADDDHFTHGAMPPLRPAVYPEFLAPPNPPCASPASAALAPEPGATASVIGSSGAQPGRAWVAPGLCGKLETSAPRFPHAPAFSSCKAARRG